MTSFEREIAKKNITEVLHFTTQNGVIGVLDSGFLKSRERVAKEDRLSFIFKANSEFRKDANWLDYVNLSISQVNFDFLGASKNWHKDTTVWWAILSFSPAILSHDGVYFTTTNNIYPSAQRGTGLSGFNKMFGQKILGRYSTTIERSSEWPSNCTTCPQAEVLYPKELSTDFLTKIYVCDDDHADSLSGFIAGTQHRDIEIITDPTKFEKECL